MEGPRLYAPSFQRNGAVIRDALRTLLPRQGLVLEIASGSGEHVTLFAEALHALTFQPSDPTSDARESVDAWAETLGLKNVRPAIALDVTDDAWSVARADAVLCINMIHIAPWAATLGLLRGASRILSKGAPLMLYGPFRREDGPTAASNEAFDADLKSRDPAWGLRTLELVAQEAAREGFGPPDIEAMPANNLLVSFRRW